MLPRNLLAEITEAKNTVSSAILKKVKDEKVNMAMVLAEGNQTVNMITTFATNLAKSLHAIKRGDLQGALRPFGLHATQSRVRGFRLIVNSGSRRQKKDAYAAAVLQVQYGVRPLISDIIGMAELAAQKASQQVTTSVRHKVKISLDSERSSVVKSSYNAYLPYEASAVEMVKGEIEVRCEVDFESEPRETRHLLAQMGLTNPLFVAWESLPYSFVLDWLIPVSDYLSNVDATIGVVFVDGSISVKINRHHTRTISVTGGVDAQGVNTYVEKSYVREKLSGFPSNPLPSFRQPLSIERCINALALVVGARKKLGL